jgi:hypothetical protein
MRSDVRALLRPLMKTVELLLTVASVGGAAICALMSARPRWVCAASPAPGDSGHLYCPRRQERPWEANGVWAARKGAAVIINRACMRWLRTLARPSTPH